MRGYSTLLKVSFVLYWLLAGTAAAQNGAEAQKSAIRSLLSTQVDAWNRGDLEGFMAGYWKSPELSFISGTTETRGWQPTLDRYRKKYQGEGKEMGKLDFFDLRVEMLAPDAAFVRGHWHLRMKDGKEPGGLFTLILRKFPEGWRIIHDHTS
jgi:beta-aspartyl-peptidase (threonine type)